MIRFKDYEVVREDVKEHLKEYLEYKGIKFKGRSFKCFCHNDENASAGLTDDGKGYKCFACNAKGDIFTAYSILENKKVEGKEFFIALKELSDLLGVSYERADDDFKNVKEREYIYTHADGYAVYKIERYHKEDLGGNILLKPNGKSEKIFLAFTKVEDNWEKGMKTDTRYLYNLPSVIKCISNNEEVYLVEGEKCVDILNREFGLTATTIPFGANAWKEPYIEAYKEQLRGARIVLLPDNDSNGYGLMESIGNDLKKSVKSLRTIKLSGDTLLPEGGDIEDWIRVGGTKDRLLLLKEQATDIAEIKKDWYFKDDKGNVKIITGLLAKHLIEEYPSIYCEDKFYIYKNGVYKECKSNEVQSVIKSQIEDRYLRMSTIRDVEGLWSIDKEVARTADQINTDSCMINLKNGLFNVLTAELERHSPKILSTIQLNVEHNEKICGTEFHKFLNRVMPDRESQLLLQEITGYSMSTFTKAKKMFLFYGPHDSGKTTFLNLINEIIGEAYVSHVNMQSMNEKFYSAELKGKVANIATELPDKGIDDVGMLKAMVGQDRIMASKKFQDPFSFVNTAKLIFACNKLPQNYGDKSDSFYNKIIITYFNQVIPDEEIDVMLPEKLEMEKSYVFLWAMDGLRRLIQNGFKFSETDESKKTVEKFMMQSNTVMSFVHECCIIKSEAEALSTDLYKSYVEYCKDCNYKVLGRNSFKSELESSFSNKIIPKLITNNRLSGYTGITLKSCKE